MPTSLASGYFTPPPRLRDTLLEFITSLVRWRSVDPAHTAVSLVQSGRSNAAEPEHSLTVLWEAARRDKNK